MSYNNNILIIDDEPGAWESLLKPFYNTFTASNSNTAVELIKQFPIDLVTLDLKMPGINGTEFIKEIKQLKPDIEVIVITGYRTLKIAIECIRFGVFDYITKPFNVPEIISIIKKSLIKRQFKFHKNIAVNN
jgi:DNA-binding NtrC family response regulator